MTDLRSPLIRALTQRRYDLKLSQVDADIRCGFADGLVAKWECGSRIPSLSSIAAWAQSYNCALVLQHNFPPPFVAFNDDQLVEELHRRGMTLNVIPLPPNHLVDFSKERKRLLR